MTAANRRSSARNTTACRKRIHSRIRAAILAAAITGAGVFASGTVLPPLPVRAAIQPAAEAETTAAKPSYAYRLQRIHHHDWEGSDDGLTALAYADYDELQLSADSAYEYSNTARYAEGVAKALATVNAETQRISGSFVSDNIASARETFDARGDETGFPSYQDLDTLTVIRADTSVLSILRSDFQYYGGAHGLTTSSAYSFNPETGDLLRITDVLNVSSTSELAQVLAAALRGQNDPERFEWDLKDPSDYAAFVSTIEGLIAGDADYNGINDTAYVTWYVDRGGVSFVFDQYQLGSYAAGSFTARLTREQYPDLIVGHYTASPEKAITALQPFDTVVVNGKDLSIDYDYDTYGFISNVTVSYGNLRIPVIDNATEIRPFLAQIPEGNYLYISIWGESDWQSLAYICLDAEKPAAEMFQEGFANEIPLDPDNMVLSTRTSLLSTIGIERSYHIDPAAGAPAANDALYTMPSQGGLVWLTLRQDAELTVLDSADGSAVHTEVFPEGTRIAMVRTDNTSFVDCATENGKFIRLNVDASSYPQHVDGIALEDLLDGAIVNG